MIEGRRVLALITARGGSKRLPGKNVRLFAGKPLIAWTVEAALNSAHVDRVVVSSDDAEIIGAAEAAGAESPFVRPPGLAGDAASSADVALHALNSLDARFDLLVLLQPTSPLRNAQDIDACLQMAVRCGKPVAAVATPLQHPKDFRMVDGDGALSAFPCAALAPAPPAGGAGLACLTGAVYVVDVHDFFRQPGFAGEGTLAYFMPPERSLDIDTELDFRLAEYIFSTRSIS